MYLPWASLHSTSTSIIEYNKCHLSSWQFTQLWPQPDGVSAILVLIWQKKKRRHLVLYSLLSSTNVCPEAETCTAHQTPSLCPWLWHCCLSPWVVGISVLAHLPQQGVGGLSTGMRFTCTESLVSTRLPSSWSEFPSVMLPLKIHYGAFQGRTIASWVWSNSLEKVREYVQEDLSGRWDNCAGGKVLGVLLGKVVGCS